MKLVADSRGRLTSAELFTPGTAFDASWGSEGEIVLRKLVPEVRRVKFAKVKHTKDGKIVVELPRGATVADKAIEEAVRAERDSR